MKKSNTKFNTSFALTINLLLNTAIFFNLLLSAFPFLSIFNFLIIFFLAPAICIGFVLYRADRFLQVKNYAPRLSIVVSYLFSFLIAYSFCNYDWKNSQLLFSPFLSISLLSGLTMDLLIQIINDKNVPNPQEVGRQ